MKDIVLTRETVIWLVLMTLTLVSWLIGTHPGTGTLSLAAGGSIIIAVGFFKVYLVIQNFMEVRHAPVALKAVCNAWLLLSGTVLVSMYNNWV